MATQTHRSLKLQFMMLAVFLFLSNGGVDAEEFDHGRWDKILGATVSEEGWVDYAAINKNWAGELKAYIKQLGDATVARLSTREEKKAFWINAYNAVCVQTLIDTGLPDEVPHAFFFGKNIFKEENYRIAGKVRPLDEIEHEILRPKFKDSRVHAALVCGASSCPRLRREAYTGAKIDLQLDEEARRWVQVGKDKKGKRKNYLDRQAKTFYVSMIFDWFEEDFGDSTEGVLKFLKRFASEEDKKFLSQNRVRVRYLKYDWTINSQPVKKK